ncbi:hypothetical protein K431DRAFT_239695 [Polychaeton citri CBS 116435]|uniref:GDS1 winged helix domain-containing protein n=1 Tax=Polychaeton citri CBS 116435 TaxID=1314669 RepID=A0A9P4QHD5_9PEZI|nr:hypothetical protein K431DRAFT_239695 [Polychaeton citri CBS 116435]
MPYNTRRKSLSLSELGIQLPKRSRAQSQSMVSPPNTIVEGDEPPIKKSKRLHDSASPVAPMSPPRTTSIRVKEEKTQHPATTLSPPPSPGREGTSKIDTEGINDDIVVGAIRQLERTGNRPHLVKELAHTLATSNPAVEKSANPCALISSRLTHYLNRTWPAISPCPLAKDLSPVHPRRLYFFLTTQPHQPIPEVAEPIPDPKRIISPSISSASAGDDEDRFTRDRAALSPSPEVDLSSPEFDEADGSDPPQSPGRPFSDRNSMSRDRQASATDLSYNRRAASPQLEREEHDFKQTAHALHEQAQQRRTSGQVQPSHDTKKVAEKDPAETNEAVVSIEVDDSEEVAAKRNSEDAAALFGSNAEHLKLPAQPQVDFSSPVIQPQREDLMNDDNYQDTFNWDNLELPENIELDELETMFDAY